MRAIFGDKAGDVKDTSLRVPPGIAGIVIGAQVFSRLCQTESVLVGLHLEFGPADSSDDSRTDAAECHSQLIVAEPFALVGAVLLADGQHRFLDGVFGLI